MFIRPPSPRICAGLALGIGILLSGVALWFSPLNQDEGWYLLSAARTADGAMPYRDYAFTQGPVFPLVYQLATPLVERWGLAGGRGFTLVLGWISILISAWTVYRIRRREDPWFAVCLVLVLLGLNTFHAQYLTTVKTYALAGLWLAAALGSYLLGMRHRSLVPLVFAALFLSLAAATRVSLVLFFPALAIPLLLETRKRGHIPWILFSGCGLSFLVLIFLPFALQAGEGLRFGLIDYHQARTSEGGWIFKAAFLSRFCLAYLPCALLALISLAQPRLRTPGLWGVLLGACAVSLFHLFTPFPYEDYQVVVLPAIVLVLALQTSEAVVAPRERRRTARLLLAFGLLFALSSPQWRDWFSSGRDRIWWKVRTEAPLAQLQRAAKELRALDPEAEHLLTCDAYLAVEAGLGVPVDLNMGPFSFFPDMQTERAARLHVLNPERLQNLLGQDPPRLAALSGYAFTIQSPEIVPLAPGISEEIDAEILKVYSLEKTLPDFGQAQTDLKIYRLRDPDR